MRDVTSFRPVFAGAAEADALVREPGVVVVDALAAQLEQLARARAPRADLTAAETSAAVERILGGAGPPVWAFYPWSGRLVRLLPEPLHRELRFDRNRYAITAAEQERLLGLRIAVAGLSVGRAVVTTLAHEGIG